MTLKNEMGAIKPADEIDRDMVLDKLYAKSWIKYI